MRDALRGNRLREPLEQAAYGPDGRGLAVAQRKGRTTAFQLRETRDGGTLPLAPQRVADRACARAGGGLTRNEWRTYLPTLEYRRTC